LPYAAIGAGSSYALGALYALEHNEYPYMAHMALSAAAKFCPYVVAPFKFIEV